MPRVLHSIAIGLLLLAEPSVALAHGMEGVVQPLVIVALVVGAIAGLLTGGTDSHPGAGLLSSIGMLIVVVTIYLVIDWDGPGIDLVGAFFMMLILIAFAGAIPLTIAYFIAFTIATFVRERFGSAKKKSDDAVP